MSARSEQRLPAELRTIAFLASKRRVLAIEEATWEPLQMLLSLFSVQQLPIVLMHGIFQSAKDLSDMKRWLEEALPGTYVKNCEVGSGVWSSVMMPIAAQTARLSECINSDERLARGFVGIGYSQGGLLMRSYLENYNHNHYPMKRLIALASPLAGVYCGAARWCYLVEKLPFFVPASLAYSSFVQGILAVSNYWRDTWNYDKFVSRCPLLAALDNMCDFKLQRKKNFQSIDKLVVFGSERDEVIAPQASAFFGQFAPGSTLRVLSMEEREEYREDLFGLRTLREQGRLVCVESRMLHFQYPRNESFVKGDLVFWVRV